MTAADDIDSHDTGPAPADSPAERRRRKIRDAIIEAAERVFSNEGEAGLSIRRLADEVDYSPAAIYKYFRNKDELVIALKDAFFERLLAKIAGADNCDRPFLDRLRNCVVVYVQTALEHPNHYAAAFLTTSQSRPDEDYDGFRLSPSGQAYQWLRGMLEEGMRLGDLAPAPLALTTRSFWAGIHGLAILAIQMPNFLQPFPDEPTYKTADLLDYHADCIANGFVRREK